MSFRPCASPSGVTKLKPVAPDARNWDLQDRATILSHTPRPESARPARIRHVIASRAPGDRGHGSLDLRARPVPDHHGLPPITTRGPIAAPAPISSPMGVDEGT